MIGRGFGSEQPLQAAAVNVCLVSCHFEIVCYSDTCRYSTTGVCHSVTCGTPLGH